MNMDNMEMTIHDHIESEIGMDSRAGTSQSLKDYLGEQKEIRHLIQASHDSILEELDESKIPKDVLSEVSDSSMELQKINDALKAEATLNTNPSNGSEKKSVDINVTPAGFGLPRAGYDEKDEKRLDDTSEIIEDSSYKESMDAVREFRESMKKQEEQYDLRQDLRKKHDIIRSLREQVKMLQTENEKMSKQLEILLINTNVNNLEGRNMEIGAGDGGGAGEVYMKQSQVKRLLKEEIPSVTLDGSQSFSNLVDILNVPSTENVRRDSGKISELSKSADKLKDFRRFFWVIWIRLL
eukprot:UN32710